MSTSKELRNLGRKKAYLEKCVDLQQCLNEHYQEGVTKKWFYERHVRVRFRISQVTFHKMLNEVNPNNQLTQINQTISHVRNKD